MHVIGTAGHVDHGKSTLVHRLTGIDPDRFEEEKRRGLTIDLGFAWFTLPSGNEVGIVDVPGHERFVRNMLAGAGGVTVCLFVVAADEGWKPQSAEHLAIIDILGVTSGVVAVTRSDLVDDAQLARVEEDVASRLSGTSLEGSPIVACSAITGGGLEELVGSLDEVVRDTDPPRDEGRPRLWIDRVFTIAGAGTVVTGTSAGGTFTVGDVVEIAPEGRSARVRTIQSHKRQVELIGPGNRAALNLAGLERQGAQRGDALVRPHSWIAARIVDVELQGLPDLRTGAETEIRDKGARLLYAGSAEVPVRLKLLGTDRVRSGQRAFAQLRLRDPLPLTRGDRFVLRDAGRALTIGGGRILDPLAEPVSRNDRERLRSLEALASDDPAALEAYVDVVGSARAEHVRARLNLDPDRFEGDRLGPWLVSHRTFATAIDDLRARVAEHHESRRLEPGIPREALRAALDVEPGTLDELIARTEDVIQTQGHVHLRSHRVDLSTEELREREELIATLNRSAFEPPLTKALDTDPDLLRALEHEGAIVKVGGFYLTADRAEEAKAAVIRLIEEEGPITVAQIRDLLGTSRKYAVPLCEWLDSIGVTRRRGDQRILGPHALD